MFESFPNQDRSGNWISFDDVRESDVRAAIRDASDKQVHAQDVYKQALENPPEFSDQSLAHSWAAHVSNEAHRAAGLGRIQAVLLTATHLEGVVNSWGVHTVGETFFKQHLERSMIESKVALLFAIGGQGRISRDHNVLVLLRDLFSRRNQMVHRKTREIPFGKLKDLKTPTFDEDLSLCSDALDAFRELMLRLCPRAALLAGGYKHEEGS